MQLSTLFIEKLQQQNANAVNKCYGKNALCCFVAAGIDVIREQSNVAYQTPHTKKSDQLVLPEKFFYKFAKAPACEPDKINNDKNDQRRYKAKDQSHLQIIFP